MTRRLANWLNSYMEFVEGTEAPKLFHFWVGVATIAGALRKHVWLDMKRFKWTANFYIILVAPPGVATKTTTMDMGFDLLKQVPGINFGPDVITWQALVKRFAESGEMFQCGEDFIPMSALTLASGELGNLINPFDKDMVNLYISLWDGRAGFSKETKMSGNDQINSPWINMVGCTTPDWIAENFPQSMIGGGFVSRCVFVYGEEKENLIAWPDEHTKPDYEARVADLVADLEYISVNLVGPMRLDEGARRWGKEWYENLWRVVAKAASEDQVRGYLARKQGHMVKLAMVLSVSRSDSLVVTEDDLKLADLMLHEVELSYSKVFSRIGRSDVSLQAERLLEFVKRYGKVPYQKAYQHIYSFFPDFRDFEGIVTGLLRSGQVKFDLSDSADPTKGNLVYIEGGK